MPDERARHDLRQALTGAIGAEEAATLMEQLPPVPWDRLATKDDVESFGRRIDLRFQALEHKLTAAFRAQVIDQNRRLFFGMIGAIVTAASLAFAVARF